MAGRSDLSLKGNTRMCAVRQRASSFVRHVGTYSSWLVIRGGKKTQPVPGGQRSDEHVTQQVESHSRAYLWNLLIQNISAFFFLSSSVVAITSWGHKPAFHRQPAVGENKKGGKIKWNLIFLNRTGDAVVLNERNDDKWKSAPEASVCLSNVSEKLLIIQHNHCAMWA